MVLSAAARGAGCEATPRGNAAKVPECSDLDESPAGDDTTAQDCAAKYVFIVDAEQERYGSASMAPTYTRPGSKSAWEAPAATSDGLAGVSPLPPIDSGTLPTCGILLLTRRLPLVSMREAAMGSFATCRRRVVDTQPQLPDAKALLGVGWVPLRLA